MNMGGGASDPALQELQIRDTLRMINNMVDMCFSECVTNFRGKSLTETEDKCVSTCSEKFLKHQTRVGQRFHQLFAEQQQKYMEQQQSG